MTMTKLCTVLLLALCLLTACGGRGEEAKTSAIVYVPEEVNFSNPLDRTESACIAGDMVYLLGAVRDDETFAETLTLVRVPLDGGKAEALPGFRSAQLEPDGKTEYDSAGGTLHPGADGTLWLMESVHYQRFDLPEGFDPEKDAGEKYRYITDSGSFWVLRQLDSEGNELFSFNAAGLQRELDAGWFADLYSDGAGTIFVSTDSAVVLLDESGAVRAALEGGGRMGARFVTLGDGRTAIPVTAQGADGAVTQLRVIDTEAGDWAEESFSVPFTASDFQSGDGDALFYYLNGDGLYAWRQGAEEPERVMSWTESGVDPINMSAFSFLADGRLATVTSTLLGFESSAEITVLTATDAAALPERTVLTLATVSLTNGLRAAVTDFNRHNASSFITVTEYLPANAYTDADTFQQAALRMVTALTVGEVPDIICLGNDLPVRRMEDQGMLEDLWPYIDNDPELGRDALMTRPLEAMEYKGGLYRITNAFTIASTVGAKAVVGDRMTWTYDDFWAALESMPEGSTHMGASELGGRNAMLEAQLQYNMPLFLDLENGVCQFDGEEFRALLEFCSRFPEEPPQIDAFIFDSIYFGEQMLFPGGVNGFTDLQEKRALFGGDIAFVGWPNESGRVGSSFEIAGIPLAICASSAHKEEAWSFLREQLLPSETVSLKDEGGSNARFPINRQDFQRMVELAMTPKVEGGPLDSLIWFSSYTSDAMILDYYPLTEEEYDQFMALYNAAEGINEFDSDSRHVVDIITEQAGACFAGDRSLDDTVAAIQSRVGLYLAELQ